MSADQAMDPRTRDAGPDRSTRAPAERSRQSSAQSSTHNAARNAAQNVDAPAHAIYVLLDPGIPAYGRKGASVHVQAIMRELARRCERVDLITVRVGGAAPPDLERVEVTEVPQAGGRGGAEREAELVRVDAEVAAEVARRVRASRKRHGRPPLVYQRYSLFSGSVMGAAREAGGVSVLEVNAPLVAEQATHRSLHAREAAEEATRRALVEASHVVAVSSGVARWAEETSGRAVQVVPNGVDLGRYTPAGAREAATPVVAFVSGFRPWHDPDQLVRAAAAVRARGDLVSLLFVGDGPALTPACELGAALGVPIETTGSVAPEEIPALLARADIAVAPYPAGDAYFSPLKVAEYFAAGLPTVLSAVADLPTLVRPGEALLVPPGDEDAFVGALARLARDAGERGRMGGAARAAASRFTWEAALESIIAGVNEAHRAARAVHGRP